MFRKPAKSKALSLQYEDIVTILLGGASIYWGGKHRMSDMSGVYLEGQLCGQWRSILDLASYKKMYRFGWSWVVFQWWCCNMLQYAAMLINWRSLQPQQKSEARSIRSLGQAAQIPAISDSKMSSIASWVTKHLVKRPIWVSWSVVVHVYSVVVPGLSPKSDFGRFNLSPMDLQSEWWIHTIWLRCSSLSAHSAPNCDWGANIHFSFNSRILRVAWRERIRQHPSGKNTPTSPMPFITCVTEKLSDPTKNGEIWIVSNHLKNLWFKSFKSVKSPSCLLKDHHKYSINWLKRPQPSHSRAVRTKRKALKSFTTSPSPGPQLSGSWLGFPFPFWKQSKL